ncbi:hypothetical protein LGR64_06865 [Delftia sp. Lp-1]|uniref:hypothetical protein n=1 Tax=Delftia sp. Lp-1 TaxID=682863 RepID=UPI001E3FC8A9|nr:hypothetical protein [Delftia sp. Lp-1]MCB4785987.1 hypothetical protein [Delftia sp. Lp-1]
MNTIEFGDCRDTMRAWAAQGVRAQMCVTSLPYFGLRDYGHAGQLGLEQTLDQYIAAMVRAPGRWLYLRQDIEASSAPPTARPRRRATQPPEPEPAQRGLF